MWRSERDRAGGEGGVRERDKDSKTETKRDRDKIETKRYRDLKRQKEKLCFLHIA